MFLIHIIHQELRICLKVLHHKIKVFYHKVCNMDRLQQEKKLDPHKEKQVVIKVIKKNILIWNNHNIIPSIEKYSNNLDKKTDQQIKT